MGPHPAQPSGWIQMPSQEREGGKEVREERREEGREEEFGALPSTTPPREATLQRLELGKHPWTGPLLGPGRRPKAARKGWEESPRLLPAPQEEPAGLAPGALGPRCGGFASATQDTSNLTVRVGVYSVGFWGAPLAPRLSGNFCQIKPVCLPQHVKKKRHLFLDFKKITCYPWQALMFK